MQHYAAYYIVCILIMLESGVHPMIKDSIWLQSFQLSSHRCLYFHNPPRDYGDSGDESEGNFDSGDDNYDRNSDNVDCNNHQDENSDDVEV